MLTLAFLPALYAIWFRVSYVDAVRSNDGQQARMRKNWRELPNTAERMRLSLKRPYC